MYSILDYDNSCAASRTFMQNDQIFDRDFGNGDCDVVTRADVERWQEQKSDRKDRTSG